MVKPKSARKNYKNGKGKGNSDNEIIDSTVILRLSLIISLKQYVPKQPKFVRVIK